MILRSSSDAQNSPGELYRASLRLTCSNRVFSALEEIEKRSQALLKKKKAAGFFDKAKDSQEVVNLVEELRNAIVYYQVSRDHGAWAGVDTDITALAATVGVPSNWKPDRKDARQYFWF